MKFFLGEGVEGRERGQQLFQLYLWIKPFEEESLSPNRGSKGIQPWKIIFFILRDNMHR